jgi:hypothetical protein
VVGNRDEAHSPEVRVIASDAIQPQDTLGVMRVGACRVFLRIRHPITVRVGVSVSAARRVKPNVISHSRHSIGISVCKHAHDSVGLSTLDPARLVTTIDSEAVRECRRLQIRDREKTGRAIYFNVRERTPGFAPSERRGKGGPSATPLNMILPPQRPTVFMGKA